MMADHNAIDVPAQDAAEPDARLLADLGVADYPGAVSEEHTGADLRPLSEILQHIGHGVNSDDAHCKMQSSFGKIAHAYGESKA
jgi:hypothetical protein